jgi:hypothetical protein
LVLEEEGWSTEWASDKAGSALGRQLSLYRPLAGPADYRIDFEGRIQRAGLGLVFRAVDSANYYAAAIRPDAAGQLALSRFAVIKRVQEPGVEKRLPVTYQMGAVYRVRIDVRGPRFTLFIQDRQVESWSDHRLKAGSFGFMNDRNDHGEVVRVRMSYLEGGASRSGESLVKTLP